MHVLINNNSWLVSVGADARLMMSMSDGDGHAPLWVGAWCGVFSSSSTEHGDTALADVEEGPGDCALEHYPAARRRLCHGEGLWGEAAELHFVMVPFGALVWLWEILLLQCHNAKKVFLSWRHVSQLPLTTTHSRLSKEQLTNLATPFRLFAVRSPEDTAVAWVVKIIHSFQIYERIWGKEPRAAACVLSLLQESGLSVWIGGRLHPLEGVPPPVAVILITIVIALFTEFASNTATIIIFLPVLAELVRQPSAQRAGLWWLGWDRHRTGLLLLEGALGTSKSLQQQSKGLWYNGNTAG